MTYRVLTEEEFNALIAKAQAHSDVMSELGSEQGVEEAGQILNALSELKRYREGVALRENGKA